MAKTEFIDLISDFAAEYYKNQGENPYQNNGQTGGTQNGAGSFSPVIGGSVNSGISGAEKKAEVSIEELRNKYSERTRAQYEQKAKKLRAERDEALRENWVLQQQAEAALPEQLAAAGLNGGAAETTLAALKARYQGNRNDIRSGYMDNLGGISEEFAAQQAETEREYNEKWIDYLLSLAKSEKEFEQKKALAAMQK